MKKFLKLLIIVWVLPVMVYADSLVVSCPDKVKVNEEFTCTIKGESTKKIVDLKLNVSPDSDISYVGFTPVNWQGSGEDKLIALYTDIAKTGTFDIGTVKFKKTSSSSSKITFENVFFYDEADNKIGVDNVTKEIVVNTVTNNDNNNNNVVNNDDNKQNEVVKETEEKEDLEQGVVVNESITTIGADTANSNNKTNNYMWIFIIIIAILIIVNASRMLKKNNEV